MAGVVLWAGDVYYLQAPDHTWKWSGSAMGLGKLSVPGRDTKLDNIV